MPSHTIRIAAGFLALSIGLCGCSSRIISPDVSLLAPRLAVPSQPEQRALSYSIIGAGRKDSKDVEKVFEEAFSAHGVSVVKTADNGSSEGADIIVYLLPAQFKNELPGPLAMMSLFALLPTCGQSSYPVQFHALSKRFNRSNFQDEYILRECEWLPTMFTTDERIQELKVEALRAVFDRAAMRMVSR